MNLLCIIPARGGSKGLPGKNIKIFNGQPLIAHSIIEAKKSKYIDKVVVSTDDYEIAGISRKYGAEIPFMRPSELARDSSRIIDTYCYTINRLKNEFKFSTDILIVLQPTSPLRRVNHIDEAIELFLEKSADSVVSLAEVAHPPYWYKNMDTTNKVSDFITMNDTTALRQELPKVYCPNGAIFIFKADIIVQEKQLYTERSFGYLMSAEESVDIDSLLDFKIAEMVIKDRNKGEKNEV